MKIFLAYKYTGEDPEVLKGIIDQIVSSLGKAGHTTFCSFDKNVFFTEQSSSYKQRLEYVITELDSSDYVLAFVKSQEKSEGMLLEVGYALAKGKKIILAIKSGVHVTFLSEIADVVIEFEEPDDLYSKLKMLFLS